MNFIKRVCCLYRVSTEKQMEKNDIPMQRTACQEFAEEKGWKIVEEHYEKGVSGYKVSADDRDAIQDIKQSALAGNFDVLLVFMFDRIGRREDETPFVVQFFVKQGVQVWSTQEGEQRFDNHVDKLMNYIRFWQASGESEKTSIRTKTRMGQMVKEGKFKGGVAPYGYKLEKTGRTNKRGNEVYDIFIDKYESTIVKIMFQKYALEGMGTHQLAMHLTESGILPRKGISWHPSTLLHLLKNIQYQGILRSGDSRSESFDELRIIEDTLFNKVQKLITARSKKSDPKRTEPMSTLGKALLSGNCFCAHCGGRLTPSTGGGKRALADGTVVDRTRNRYSCYNKTRKRKPCDGQTTYEALKIDNIVEDTVRLILSKLKATPKEALTGSLEHISAASYSVLDYTTTGNNIDISNCKPTGGHTVAFNYNGVTPDNALDLPRRAHASSGNTIPAFVAAPVKSGDTFAGWYTDTALTTPWDFASDTVDGTVTTLYAKWASHVAPTVPLSFTATAGDAKIDLAWAAPSGDGGSAITKYEVQKDSDSWVTAATNTSHSFTGLTNGTAYSFKVRAVNAIGGSPEATATATPTAVAVAPNITTATLPNGIAGSSYSQTLAATGTTPITWSLASGNLPVGLNLSSSGVISGTPTTAGTFNVVVKASNGTAPDATKALTIVVDPVGTPPVVPTITISITTQPVAETTVTQGSISGSLSIFATVSDSSTPTYQWYALPSNTAVSGATGSSFPIPTELSAGSHSYYCIVYSGSATATSITAKVLVVPPVVGTAKPSVTTQDPMNLDLNGSNTGFATVTLGASGAMGDVQADHAAVTVISKTDWKLVQELLITKSHIVKINRNLVKKEIYLTKVKTGVLKGFTIVDYRWNKNKTIQVMKKLNIIKESEYE